MESIWFASLQIKTEILPFKLCREFSFVSFLGNDFMSTLPWNPFTSYYMFAKKYSITFTGQTAKFVFKT